MSLRLVMDTENNKVEINGNVIQAAPSGGINFVLNNDKGLFLNFNFNSLARERPCSNICTHSKELVQEVNQAKEEIQIHDEASSRQVALRLLEEDYSKMGQLIECACCFGESVFDNMAQCTEGHLVCVECLHSYINEIAFGAGKIDLSCMMPECTAEYPQCELRRCLDSKIQTKLEERTLLENLNAAQIEDLVRCPYCEFAAILPPDVNMFSCYGDTCGKVTCRHCSKDWEDHEGLTCDMVECKGETSLRKEYEEKMTKAKVRTCTNCNTEFTKEVGCNRMTCRCGMTMCYICRTPGVTYEHFYTLTKRSVDASCPLWTDPEKDDEMAIQEIQQEASRKRKELGYEENRDIGVPDAKKVMKKTGI